MLFKKIIAVYSANTTKTVNIKKQRYQLSKQTAHRPTVTEFTGLRSDVGSVGCDCTFLLKCGNKLQEYTVSQAKRQNQIIAAGKIPSLIMFLLSSETFPDKTIMLSK
jgi:hypothetical protein